VASWHFVIETKGAPHAQRSKKHTKNSEKRFYKSRSSSALRKRHYLLVLELGVTKSLTQNGNNRPVFGFHGLSSRLRISARIPN
jgi:hypothetical protein